VPGPSKVIFHVDMDAFFVSVEELFDPSLRDKPVVVGGQRDERGVVAAASYEARKFGVHSAMPLRTAARLCPNALFVDGHPARYRDYSARVYKILKNFSPRVEMISIDEAFLDMSGTERLLGPVLRSAHSLHDRIKTETQLNCSIGIGTSRLVAKISSDMGKPNGILWVPAGAEAAFLAPLPVRKMPGVGKVTERALHDIGILTLGQLAQFDAAALEAKFGKWGTAMHEKARGLDSGAWFEGEVGEDGDPKSISHEHTFGRDTADAAKLRSTLARLSEMVGRRVREQHFFARTVQLKLRYTDFTTITRAHTLHTSTNLDTEIFECVAALFEKNWTVGRTVRLLGVQVSSLETQQGQEDLLQAPQQRRWSRVLEAADHLRDKYGDSSVMLGGGMPARFREKTHENPAGLPGKHKDDPESP
jgi:DNA polymerase IV